MTIFLPSIVTLHSPSEKQARSNDIASSYELEHDGDLFRIMKDKKKTRCQITTNVSEIKISQHPKDVGMLYFKKNGNLYILRDQDTERGKTCPATDKSIMAISPTISCGTKPRL